MEKRFIIGIDEGTTSERVVLYDIKTNKILDNDSAQIKMSYPKSGWVEQDAKEIFNSVLRSIKNIITRNKLKQQDVLGIAITNQRETVVAWDDFGNPVGPAIVWQCRRTAEFCDSISQKDKEWLRKKTGLIMDAYFSVSKMKWILENNKHAQKCAKEGTLHMGTIDSYLVYCLTKGKSFVTDTTNASRTMLVDLKSLQNGVFDFDKDLLKYFGIDRAFLPRIVNSAECVGNVECAGLNLPILSIVGDQQGSLFGQGCFKKGQAKNTYGTGCFFMQNVSTDIEESLKASKLLTTVAWSIKGKTYYAVEGSIFHAGSMSQWLVEGVNLVEDVSQIEKMCTALKSNEGVYLFPAFTGIGAPYWNGFLRAEFSGLTLATKREHFVRACMESICYLTNDILSYAKTFGFSTDKLVCDGGVSKNNFVMQFQADILNKKIYKSMQSESTVMGAIYLAMISAGVVKSTTELTKFLQAPKEFIPQMTKKQRESNLLGWQKVVQKVLEKQK